MNACELKNKNVVVVGLGLTGQSCVAFLVANGAHVSAMDSRSALELEIDIPIQLGEFDQERLVQAELIIISPGVDPRHPAIQLAIAKGVEVIGDVELFARLNQVPVIAITGSNGKSTVTTLVFEIFKHAGKTTLMGGNIGTPVLELLGQPADFIVLELSSFQLETVRSLSPFVATILNVSDDHLDRHVTLKNYQQVKQRVYANAQHCIVNRDDSLTWNNQQDPIYSIGLSQNTAGFSWDKQSGQIRHNGFAVLSTKHSQLVGSHNALNIQVAAACAMLAGIEMTCVQQTIDNFSGLSHRFETVLESNNVIWINDSKATNVGATLAAINSVAAKFSGNLILIAGGEGKGSDFTPLANAFKNSVSLLITLGVDGPKLAKLSDSSISVSTMLDAVKAAKQYSKPGDVVLLSPACASFDMFNNYQHRGDSFANAVLEVAA